MSCLKIVWKEGQTAQIQIAISQGLIEFFHTVFCSMSLEIMPLKL